MDETPKPSKIVKILRGANVARTISDHLLGECHPIKHRMWVGGGLMVIGVMLSKAPGFGVLHLLFDGVGYLIHGAGAIPFIDWLGHEKDPDKPAEVPKSCITPDGEPGIIIPKEEHVEA